MIRLFVPEPLAPGGFIAAKPEAAHYLTRVMRLTEGEEILLFNGADGEWRARLAAVGKRGVQLEVLASTRPQSVGPDLDLVVALVKRARLEVIVEKAAELGVRRVRLTRTERTNADHVRLERLNAIAIEAAEQTGRLDAPQILPPAPLPRLILDWPTERRLVFCDEGGEAPEAGAALREPAMAGRPSGPWAILIGPEGGFSPAERAAVRALPQAVPVSLGPRILRADTAAVAALAVWQSCLGDWQGA